MRIHVTLIAFAALATLASCAAPKGDKTLYAEAVIGAADMQTRIDALNYTAPADIPTSGRGTFNGYAAIEVELTPEIKGLLGEARILVRFADDTVTGSLGNFNGYDANGDFVAGANGALTVGKTGPEDTGQLDGNGDPIVEIFDVSGITPATNGAAAGGFNAGLYGTLKVEGHSIYLDGVLLGNFHGPNAGAISAEVNTNGTSGDGHFRVVVIDGEVVHGTMPYTPDAPPVDNGNTKTVTLLVIAED